MKRFFIIVLIVFAFSALNADDFSETTSEIMPADGHIMFGLRAAGMGGAHIALAEDYSAIWYNPARLSYIYRAELSLGMNIENVKSSIEWDNFSRTSTSSNFRLNQLGLVFPVPTTQGGLSFALGYHRTNSFEKKLSFHNGSHTSGFEEIQGGLGYFSMAGGIQISEEASVGACIDIPMGSEDYYYELHDDSTMYSNEISSDYRGVSGRLGFAFIPNDNLSLGLNLEFPKLIDVEQYVRREDNIEIISGYNEPYNVTIPFKMGGGLALRFPYIIIAGDVSYCDYQQIEFGDWMSSEVPFYAISNSYTEVFAYAIGIEGLIPGASMKLRAGFGYEPLHYTADKIIKDRHYLTGGMGYLLSNNMSFDAALTFSKYQKQYTSSSNSIEWDEEWRNINIMMGFAYRF